MGGVSEVQFCGWKDLVDERGQRGENSQAGSVCQEVT